MGNPQTFNVPIQALCSLWTHEDIMENREPGSTVPDDLNPDLKHFFMKIQSRYFTGLNRRFIPAVIEILTQIHEKGNQAIIGKTLGVTRKTVSFLEKSNHKHLIPQAVIAALGMDLGEFDQKEPGGDHVFQSIRNVRDILESTNIEPDDILLAIRLHHEEPANVEGSNPIAIALNLAVREFKGMASTAPKSKEAPQPPRPQVIMYSKEDILYKIHGAIDPYGFSVFFFQGTVYACARALRDLLTINDQNRMSFHDGSFDREMKRILSVSSRQYQLKFKDKTFKPIKNRFYLFGEQQFNQAIPDEKKITPRDGEGRWLRKINVVEEEERHELSN